MTKKEKILYILVVVFTLGFVALGNIYFNSVYSKDVVQSHVFRARITEITSVEEVEAFDTDILDYRINFSAELRNSAQKGTTVQAHQMLYGRFALNDQPVSVGDSVLLVFDNPNPNEPNEWTFVGYNRANALAVLFIVFLTMILVIGRMKGLSTILSLALNFLIIFNVYIPSIIAGFNVYLSTIIISIVIIFTSLVLINGFNKKTVCAIVGNLGGVLIAGLIAVIMNHVLKMTGHIDTTYVQLLRLNPQDPIDLVAIIWGGIVIGSLGAIMDVAMSIASSMHEVYEHMSVRNFKTLLKSGMNVGRDAIGTMTNTLILAYVGGSLAMVLVIIVNSRNTLALFSMEMIAAQVLQSLIGSIGILLAVPFTAVFTAYLYMHPKYRNTKVENDNGVEKKDEN